MAPSTLPCTSSSRRVGSPPSGNPPRTTAARNTTPSPASADASSNRKRPTGRGSPTRSPRSSGWRRREAMRIEHWLYALPLRVRSLLRRRRVERDLDDELQDHLERKIDEYIAQGLTPQHSRRAALRDL